LRDRSKENQGKEDKVFMRQAKDGTTTLAILAPAEELGEVEGIDGTIASKPPTLGQLLGRVRVGTSYLYGFREDKRNLVKTMYPLNYNFYSSYGPSYDSTFANVTLEETNLVSSGEKFNHSTNKQFSDTIKKACLEDYTHTFVDHIIDIMEGREVPEDEKETKSKSEDDITDVDFASLRSLGAEGIDMSWIDGLQADYEERMEADLLAKSSTVEARLEATAHLLQSLKTCQNSRLAVCPNTNLTQVAGPSPRELKLASRVLDSLTSIISNAAPEQLATLPAIRKAMGVNLPAVPPSEPITVDDTPTEPSPAATPVAADIPVVAENPQLAVSS